MITQYELSIKISRSRRNKRKWKFRRMFWRSLWCISIPGRKKWKFRRMFWRILSCISIPGRNKWKWKFLIMFWRSLSIPGRKAPRLHFRWEWIFCNPFTWKMHCDEKPKLALRSETKRKTFGISFVIFLYFFCYLFVFLLLSFCISLLSFCISFYNPFTWNIHFYE